MHSCRKYMEKQTEADGKAAFSQWDAKRSIPAIMNHE